MTDNPNAKNWRKQLIGLHDLVEDNKLNTFAYITIEHDGKLNIHYSGNSIPVLIACAVQLTDILRARMFDMSSPAPDQRNYDLDS